MSEKKSNLPVKNQINLFTSKKNVDSVVVEKILKHIRAAKKTKIKNADHFVVGVFQSFINLNIDTFMYLIEHYNFEGYTVKTDDNVNIFITSSLHIANISHIYITTEKLKINLLPNEIKKLIIV